MSESPISRPGIGNEDAAKRVVEAYIKNADGLTPEKCREALSGSVVDQKGCDALKGALSDGYVTKDERAKLLEAGFSGRFVYALTDEANAGRNAVTRRAQSLGDSASKKWWAKTPSFETRQKAVDRLLELDSPEATRELLKISNDMGAQRNNAGADLLRTTIRASILEKGDRAIPSLRRALDDKYSGVQTEAVSLLGDLRSERAIRVLAQKLGKCDTDLGGAIINTLSRMNASTVLKILREDKYSGARNHIRGLSESPYGLGVPFSSNAERLHRLLTEAAKSKSPASPPVS
jgi:hypothetical protein